MRYLSGLVCAYAFAAISFAGCAESNPGAPSYDFSAVDSAVAEFMDAEDVAGLTLAVVHRDHGQIHEMGYGDFDRERVSLIASTSKVLSAGIILTLVDDGVLELDRPVAEYLDWGDHHPTATMRSLLSMMSGVPEDDPCVKDPATSLQDCARLIFQDESQSVSAGEKFQYSADAWQLAGAVAEVVSGKTWFELVEERLVAPCGLENTGYRNVDSDDPYPEPLEGGPAAIALSDNPKIGGGAYTSVADYSKVLLMHLRDGRCAGEHVLSSAMVQSMQEALVPEGVLLPIWRFEAVNYGMGWWWFEDGPAPFVDTGAWGARSVLHPEEGWGAILIIEKTTSIGSIMYRDIVPHIRTAVMDAK